MQQLVSRVALAAFKSMPSLGPDVGNALCQSTFERGWW